MTEETVPKLLSTAEIKLLNTQPIVTQNGANQLYWNPVAMSDLDSIVVTPTLFVGFERKSENEFIVHHIPHMVDGAVRLRRSKNKRTGSCSFGPVLAQKPFLRVSTGRQNHYKYHIDTLADGSQQFVLVVQNPKVVAVGTKATKARATRKKKAAKSGTGAVEGGAGEVK